MKILKSTDGDYIELSVELISETDKAILCNDGDTQVWIPKSQLEDDYEPLGCDLINIIIPEWLAINKGLV